MTSSCRKPEEMKKQYKLTAENIFFNIKAQKKVARGCRGPATVDTKNKMLRDLAFKLVNFIFP